MSQSQSQGPFGDKRTALAFFLSLIVIIAYTEILLKPELTPQSQTEQSASESPKAGSKDIASMKKADAGPIAGPIAATTKKTSSDETKTVSNEVSGIEAETETSALPSTLPTAEQITESPSVVVATPKFKAEFLLLGGQLKSFGLTEHTKELGGEEPFDLVHVEDGTPLPFGVNLLGGSDRKLVFGDPVITPAEKRKGNTITIGEGEEAQVTFQATLQSGGTYTKTYRFVGGSYFVEVSAELSNPPASSTPLEVNWSAFVPDEIAQNSYDPVNFSFLFPNDKVEHTQITELETGGKQEQIARWGSLGDKYFMASLIALGDGQTMITSRDGSHYTIAARGDRKEVKVKAFLGPKNYSELKNLNFVELHRNVDLGWFTFLAIPLLTIINFCYGLLGNYGLAIILLTLIIKFAFLPLTQVSLKSMKAMQELQPEINALKERIKDPTQLNQEMFALYKRKGVNPMGGCLPMLIQIPVFLGLYNALLNATELRHAPFALWITDLSAPEALYLFGIPVPVMIILMGLSMFFQQYLMPSNMDEQQKKIMLMMPVVFTVMFIIFPFPSGLVLYWLVNNLISIVQQVYLRTERSVGPVQATGVASFAIFLIGFILTQI